jgi:hypothetical protein
MWMCGGDVSAAQTIALCAWSVAALTRILVTPGVTRILSPPPHCVVNPPPGWIVRTQCVPAALCPPRPTGGNRHYVAVKPSVLHFRPSGGAGGGGGSAYKADISAPGRL